MFIYMCVYVFVYVCVHIYIHIYTYINKYNNFNPYAIMCIFTIITQGNLEALPCKDKRAHESLKQSQIFNGNNDFSAE